MKVSLLALFALILAASCYSPQEPSSDCSASTASFISSPASGPCLQEPVYSTTDLGPLRERLTAAQIPLLSSTSSPLEAYQNAFVDFRSGTVTLRSLGDYANPTDCEIELALTPVQLQTLASFLSTPDLLRMDLTQAGNYACLAMIAPYYGFYLFEGDKTYSMMKDSCSMPETYFSLTDDQSAGKAAGYLLGLLPPGTIPNCSGAHYSADPVPPL